MALLVAAVLCILLKLSVMRNQTKLPTIAGVLAICAGTYTENSFTVELQRLEHLWDYENMFETGVVRANEC